MPTYTSNMPVLHRVVPILEDSSDGYQSYNAELLSPGNDMVVDSEDLLNDAEAEKDDGDIAIINPEDEPVFRADDCMRTYPPELHNSLTRLVVEGMKELVLPPLTEQPPILDTQVHNWQIENWRDHPRRDHGPAFESGGHPWYATSGLAERIARYWLLTSVGAFYSSLMATM
jgi:ubiquitin carboxyl-terminal hydrolase 7